jgi:hypothetical protein
MLDGFIAPSSHARRSIHSLSEHPLVPTFTTPRHCQSRDLILDVFQSCISRARSNPTGLLVSAIASFLSPSKKTPAWVPIAIHSWIRFSTCPSRSLPLSISCFLYLSPTIPTIPTISSYLSLFSSVSPCFCRQLPTYLKPPVSLTSFIHHS